MSTATLDNPLAPRPDHVPEALVFPFDMFNDPAYLKNPHDKILELHEQAPPVFWTPYNGGVWMLMSYAANRTASRDTDRFSNDFTPPEMKAMMKKTPPGQRRVPQPRPIAIDPPEHGIYRQPLQSSFSPHTMLAMQDKIRKLAADLIEAVRPNGECEFMAAVAEPLPITVFLELLGLPANQRDIYLPLAQAHFDAMENEPHRMGELQLQVVDLMAETVQARRVEPRDDLISALWKLQIDGRPATLDDIEDFCAIIFLGGLDTVMNGMGFAVLHMAQHPELQRALRADPSLIPGAVEEMFRRYSFAIPRRRVTTDTVLEGAPMKAGDHAVVFLPAADLDPKKFENPGSFDLARESNNHMVFGAGPHRCVGAHLARIEMQVMYEELLTRIPEFRLDTAKPLTYHGGHTMRPNRVWLQWDA